VKAVTIEVSGKVQGVWFRASTKTKAEELNLAGKVKNLTNGSVFIEVEGVEGNIDRFIKWCRVGPELAAVKKVKIENMLVKNYVDFKIIRN